MSTCPHCHETAQEGAAFCSKCGSSLSQTIPFQSSIEGRPRQSWQNHPLRTIVGVTVVAFVIILLAGGLNSNSTTPLPDSSSTQSSSTTDTTTTDPTSTDTSWIPANFIQWDDNLDWRWGTDSETTCTYSSGSCWSVFVISKNGCPTNLYGEVKIFDKSDVQIDYTNDTTSTVAPLQKVQLTFDTFNDKAASARIGKLDCS